MDAEGSGRKLLLTPSGDTLRTPEKQTLGTVTVSQNMLTLQALSSSLNAGAERGSAWDEERLWVPSGSLSPRTAASIYTLQIFQGLLVPEYPGMFWGFCFQETTRPENPGFKKSAEIGHDHPPLSDCAETQ